MTRSELMTAIRDRLREGAHGEALATLGKREIAALLDLAFEEIMGAIHADGRFSYPGFGTFTLKVSGPRHGRNPRTGEAIILGASERIAFSPAERLRRGEVGLVRGDAWDEAPRGGAPAEPDDEGEGEGEGESIG